MGCAIRELKDLQVTVDKVVYMPHLECPPDRPYPFAYYITIHNRSDEVLTIKGRKWVVTDANGHRIVVEGDGVVGKFPCLAPGEKFSYNSYHVIASESVAEGSFLAQNSDGGAIFARIPTFRLKVPI